MKKVLNNIKQKLTPLFQKIGAFFSKVGAVLDKVWTFLKKYLGINWLAKVYQKKLSNTGKKAVCGYLFILPFIIGIFVFGLQPIVQSIRMAIAEFAGTKVVDGAPEFIVQGWSLTQFKQIFTNNPDHVEAILSVLGDVMVVVPLVLIFSLILSLLLNKKLKGIKIFRMIFFIPVILLSGNLLGYFERYGLLVVPALQSSELQEMLTFYLPEQVTEVIMSAFNKVILILWLGGVQTLIFLAGLQKTNKPVYEAAAIDGASSWEIFWKITFPSLLPLMLINIVYTTVIYSNLGNELTSIISSCITDPEFGRDYASALSWILFAIELVVIGIYMLALKLANKRYE